jgi:DNA-binding MarR family transcriptional regulator
VTVSLTDTGRSLRARADCIPAEVFAATGLDAESFEGLRETLQQLIAAVSAASAAG